jgi:hypothetical protein
MIISTPYQFRHEIKRRWLMSIRNRTTLIGLAMMIAACGDGGGGILGLDCLLCDIKPPSATITVNAGQDQTVIAEDTVVLSSSVNASQNCFADYKWSQTSGPPVSIWSYYPHRTAEVETPLVEMNTRLTFSLTGTCNNGATDTDAVTIHVQPTTVAALCANAPLFATSYVWAASGCVTDPADIAGDSRVATIYRQAEVEPNDSMQSASPLTFPVQIATLIDQNFSIIAGTSRGSIVEQVLHLRLEAGVPYYVGVETFVTPSEWDYNLTIIRDGR